MAMKLSWIPAIALVLASFPLVAQNQSGNASFLIGQMEGLTAKSATPSQINHPPSCPVDLRAQHLAYAAPLNAGNAAPKGQGQKLHLTLGSAAARQIVRATITAFGLRPLSEGHVWRAAPGQGASSGRHPQPEAVQTLTVPFSKGADGIATADVWLPGFSAVQTIDLKSVVYTDGSTWTLADGATCRIVPDPFMLITQH
jgi:hypothetical protein